MMMVDGKKSIVRARAVRRPRAGGARRRAATASRLLEQALDNVRPLVEVEVAARRRRDLPGPRRSAPDPPQLAGDALAHRRCPQAQREVDGASGCAGAS